MTAEDACVDLAGCVQAILWRTHGDCMSTLTTAEPASAAESTLCYSLNWVRVDPARLRADFESALASASWKRQNNYSNPSWNGIALYSRSGRPDDTSVVMADTPGRVSVNADGSHSSSKRTPLADVCEYVVRELLPQFGAPWLRVAFFQLKAGGRIGLHKDIVQNHLVQGQIRVHVPVNTNPRVRMFVGGKSYQMPEGSAWYFDPTARHGAENQGEEDRIHLLVDLKLTPALRRLLKAPTVRDRLRFANITAQYYLLQLFLFLKLKTLYLTVKHMRDKPPT